MPANLPSLPPSHRYLYRRTRTATGSDTEVCCGLNIWHVAAAASEETVQAGVMVPEFLSLFEGHLSDLDKVWLRWRNDLAASAEMRRAYSALYGRFFARALLQRFQGLTDFTPLNTGTTTAGLVTVERSAEGDIPDWIAWDTARGAYLLAEAKGALTGSENVFRAQTPPCAINGKEQFGRVTVFDAAHTSVQANGWVGANLWATDARNRKPVFLAYDPDGKGRALTDSEKPVHARAFHRQWLGSLAGGLGEPALRGTDAIDRRDFRSTVDVVFPGTPLNDDRIASALARLRLSAPVEIDEMPRHHHVGRYVAAVLTRYGLRPIRGPEGRQALVELRDDAISRDESAWLVGLNLLATDLPLKALSLGPFGTWSSDAGVVTASGLAVFDLRRLTKFRVRWGGKILDA